MIWICAETGAVIAECCMFVHLLVKYFGYRDERFQSLKTILLFLWLSFVDLFGTFYIQKESYFILSVITSEIIFSLLFLRGNMLEKIVISILSYILVYFANLPVLFLITHVSEQTITDFTYHSENVGRVISIFACKIIYFILTQIVLLWHESRNYHLRLEEWGIVVSSFIVTLALNFGMYMIAYGSAFTDYILIALSALLCVLDILVFVFVQKLSKANQQENERKLLALQIAQKQEEMKNLDKQYQELSVIRHDFKNQVNTIRELLQREKIQEALHFITTITDRSFYSVHQIVQSNSSVINAVINTRFNEAKKYQITPSCRIVSEIPEYFEYELGILLSNLLDNAIEACEKQEIENQLLIVSFSETGGYYRLVVKNTIAQSVLEHNRHLKTNKANKAVHGWGLKSVADIVEAHQGLLDFYEKDSFFIVNVMLPIRSEKTAVGGVKDTVHG